MNVLRTGILLCLSLCFAISAQGQATDEFDLDRSFSIDPNGTITLNSDDAEVTVVGSDRSDVRVVIRYRLEVSGFTLGSRNEFDMVVREENGNLVIEEQPRDFSGIMFGSYDEEYTIRIEAPRGVSFEAEGDDESYNLRELAGAVNINADDAEVRLQACRGQQFAFSLDDGSIEMDEGRGSLIIDLDDGEANIINGNFDSIELDSDDGDFNISTSLKNGSNYRFNMDDGDMALNILAGGGTFIIEHDNADISAGQAFRRTLDEENRTGFTLDGGSATIQIEVDDADIELQRAN